MYTAFITFTMKEQHRKDFIEACKENVRQSLREPGCYQFDLLQNPSDQNQFFLYEIYDTEASFKKHLETPHFHVWKKAVTPWHAEPPKFLFMNALFPTSGVRKHVKDAFMKN